MIKKLSDKIAGYLSRELNYDIEKREVLSYGLQIFLGTAIQILSILILAYFFNIFKSTIIVTISYITLRRIIGGSHADTYKKCSFISISLMVLLGALGKTIKLTYIGIVAVVLPIYVLAIAAIIIWVPAGTEKKMIKKADTRKKVKIQAVILITVWFCICHYLISLDLDEYVIQSSLGVILAFFQVTPLGYKFINLKVT